jgi:hypothetical protein
VQQVKVNDKVRWASQIDSVIAGLADVTLPAVLCVAAAAAARRPTHHPTSTVGAAAQQQLLLISYGWEHRRK